MSMPAAHSNRIGSRSRAQVEVYSPFVSCHGGGAGLSHGIRKNVILPKMIVKNMLICRRAGGISANCLETMSAVTPCSVR